MRRNKSIILAFILVIILSGCWGQNEPERMLYINGLGIDYKNGEYQIYLQIIDFKKVAKSEQPISHTDQSEVGFASGKTINEAIFKLYNSADERIYWGHLTYIVISEDALKNDGMNRVIDTLIRYKDTRYQTWLYSTDSPVKDILLTTPIINRAITLSKLGDPKNSYNQASLVEPIDIRKMIIGINEPSHEMIIPYVRVTKNWEKTTGKDKIAQLSGVGLVTPKDFKGFIHKEKINGLKWMNENTKRAEISVSLDSDKKMESFVFQKVKVKVKPVVEGDSVKFDIDIKVEGEASEVVVKTKEDELRKKAEQEIKREIEETYKEAIKRDFDIYRFSEYLYRKDLKEWKRLQQNGKIKLAEDSIRTLNVKITKFKSGRSSFVETVR